MTALALALGLAATPAMANPAGPHLDGNAYDALRPAASVAALTFAMDVECRHPKGRDVFLGSVGKPGLAGRSQVTLGPDFVVSRGRYGTVAHDFRFRRLLTIGVDARRFSNSSMYGHFGVRWLFLSNNLKTLASVAAIRKKPIPGSPLPVARFLVEHRNGMSHPPAKFLEKLPAAALDTDRQGETLVANVGDTEVLKATFGAAGFPSVVHRRSFAAWLTWFFPIHPSLARAVADDTALPSRLRFIRPEPSTTRVQSEFPVCNVVLHDVSRGSSKLDMVAGLASTVPSLPPLLPESLTRLMIDAVRLRAPNGPTSNSDYSLQIRGLFTAGRYLDAALLSLHAATSTGACNAAQDDPVLCDAIGDALRASASLRPMRTLRKAISLGRGRKHGEAAKMLISLRSQSPARPDILEVMIANELVAARRRSQLNESLRKEFHRLPSTLEAALVRDPYSPARYRDVSTYLGVAARSFEQRYATPIFQTLVLDLGRALPGGALSPLLRSATGRERKIAENFPTLFPRVGDPAE